MCGEANFQNLQLTNFHNINFQNMCVRWSKLPICKLPKHKLPTGRLPTRKLYTTSYNFAQLHTTLHNFAGVEWSGELPICKLPKLKLPTCRLPTRKLHTKCVCGEANFQLTNFHNINFQNVYVWREANFQLTHFSQHKLSKHVCAVKQTSKTYNLQTFKNGGQNMCVCVCVRWSKLPTYKLS